MSKPSPAEHVQNLVAEEAQIDAALHVVRDLDIEALSPLGRAHLADALTALHKAAACARADLRAAHAALKVSDAA